MPDNVSPPRDCAVDVGRADLAPATALRSAFDSDHGLARLVLLASPTCSICLDGVQIVSRALDRFDNPVRTYLVWLPVLEEDDPAVAAARGGELDAALFGRQFWDEGLFLSRSVHRTLGLERLNRRTAWDLCLLYGREARWPDEDPPTPHFWMQQLRIDGIPDFDEELLLVELDRHRA